MGTTAAERTPHVFLSFRNDDVPAQRGLNRELAEHLKEDLGATAVYFSEGDNHIGEDWAHRIRAELGLSDVVLALIGPMWETDPRQRLYDPDDWVAQEIATALDDPGAELVPVLVARRESPKPERLPEPLRPLATIQGFADFDLERDYERLLVFTWASFTKHMPNVVLVVSDDTASARADLEKFVAEAQGAGIVDAEAVQRLSRLLTSPPGLAVLPVKEAVASWPDVLVLEPAEASETFDQRVRAARTWAEEHRRSVGTVAFTAAASYLLGASSGHSGLIGWFGQLTTTAKIATTATAAAVVTAGGAGAWAVLTPEPIALVGSWSVTDFTMDRGAVEVEAGFLDADTFRFAPTDDNCADAGCDLTIVEGPPAAQGVVMTSETGALDDARYVSSDLEITGRCDGVLLPPEEVSSNLVVTQGESDALTFEIVVELLGEACDDAVVTYRAEATRQ